LEYVSFRCSDQLFIQARNSGVTYAVDLFGASRDEAVFGLALLCEAQLLQ